MTIIKSNEIAVDRKKFKEMLEKIERYTLERKQLYDYALKTLEVAGMAENGIITIKDKFSIKDALRLPIVGLLLQAVYSKKAQEILIGKFSYFKEILPILETIANEVNLK